MMSRIKADRTIAVVGLSISCVVILILMVIGDLWLARQEYAKNIENITPRTARLSGFIQSEKQLAVAASKVDGVLATLAYPSTRDGALTAAAMQQETREVMSSAGLSVAGSQILPSRELDGFERLNLNITVVGNINSVDEAIGNLRELRPLVLVESINIKPLRVRNSRKGKEAAPPLEDQRKITVRFRLLSLRLLR